MTTADQNTQHPDRYEIFNRNRTIGVSTVPGGAVNGLFLHENVRQMNERALTREILAVAGVASMRGRLGVRERMEAAAAANGTTVPASAYEVLPDAPTAEQYERHKRETLRY
ncbi:hypothetical protein [Mycolicibacterium fortuitum]|uniref:Uncharacterized protein n=2 Tax=Mycolicibacterium fortuitum TaxID=1766 RepID=A0AAE4VJ07_MYCFO|nr:hypothetical protein [Mycolicibacterium fortuitum]MCV7144258.1 hypothetical protein [Mycolicibacterium fortuitum]MDV7195352.1 hypothetical protein [Mycolicibacterium fortuitum]MDV7209063.1 hypothetical protein [Mycolicibacterium fortuitum]MDV7230895.1 hypothetical protein [Mycolicibacterium fortuitum]MDV7262466.1 hypothetical protein [Mycolicibacterium fortuitum]